MSFIYALVDPRCNEIRYVGKAENVSLRFWEHINEAMQGNTSNKSDWLRGLLAEGLKPDYQILEEVSDSNWREREIYWIDLHKDSIVNTHPGGFGGRIDLTDQEREKLREIASEANIRMWADPNMKAYIGKKISEACTDESRESLRQHALERWSNPEWAHMTIEKMREAANKPERKAKLSKTMKIVRNDPTKREERSNSAKKGWADPDKKAQRLEKYIGPEYSKKLTARNNRRYESVEERRKTGEKAKAWWTPKIKELYAVICKEVWAEFKLLGVVDRSAVVKEIQRRFRANL